jgi:hypothetical protein
MRRLGFLLLVALAAGCGGGAAGDATSGIEGRVTIGPQCPVMQEGSPCPDAPYPALISVTANGDTVEEGRSDADGVFRIAVAPGDYTVVAGPVDREGIASGTPVHVVVEPGVYTRVDLSVDSGIR